MSLKVKDQDREKGENAKERQAETGKDLVGAGGSILVSVKGTKENQVLIGQNDQDTEEKSHRK